MKSSPWGETKFVTISTFSHSSEAYALVSKLESEGINCILLDEGTSDSLAVPTFAIGGIRLQVPAEDEIRAWELVEKYRESVKDESSDLEQQFPGYLSDTEFCPACDHNPTLLKKRGILFYLGALLIVPIFFMHKQERKCPKCKHTWK